MHVKTRPEPPQSPTDQREYFPGLLGRSGTALLDDLAHPSWRSAPMAKHAPSSDRWYRIVRGSLNIGCRLGLRYRCRGVEHMPRQGATLLLSNHQSHLDPILAAIVCPRRLRILARESLFAGPLGWMIESLGAIPIDHKGTALAGIKQTMRCLAADEAVLVFPEGTRSPDGKLGELKTGFISHVRRKQPTLAILGIEGAYDAWPRQARWPRPRPVAMQFGRVMAPADYARLDDPQLLSMVEGELLASIGDAQRLLLA